MFVLLPEKAQGRRAVLFSLETSPGHTVAVAGSFNDWNPDAAPMQYESGDRLYKSIIFLEPGEYEYKFVVDGEWLLDESNPGFYPNDFGTLNSVLVVTEDVR